jgi:hypothetical protein
VVANAAINILMRIQELLEHQTLDEMPLPSEWKEDELSGDRTFKHRLEYVLARAARLGAGSARVAVTVEYGGRNTVIKIAKNRRGVAQNAAEVGVLTDGYLGKLPIVIPLIYYDRRNAQPTWIQTELAQRVSARKLTNLLGCTQLWDLTDAVNYVLGNKTPLGRELGEIISDLGEEGKSRSDIDRFVEYVD